MKTMKKLSATKLDRLTQRILDKRGYSPSPKYQSRLAKIGSRLMEEHVNSLLKREMP